MKRKCATRLLTTVLFVVSAWWSVTAQELALPSAPNSVKFAAIGDAGTGDPPQYDIANQMTRFHAKFPFDRVIMLGDNIYGGQGPQDLIQKIFAAVQGAARPGRQVLRHPRQPRRSRQPPVPPVEHGG